MHRLTTSATLLLLLVSSISQARTSLLETPCNNGVKLSSSAENRTETTTVDDVGVPSRWSSRMTAGAGFLRNIDKEVVKQFENAWRDSLDGSSDREGVVLMFRMRDGSYKGKSQGFTNQFRRFTFRWDPAALAIVHTHPNNCDPKPSEQDRRVADQFGVLNFTISIHGMFVYDPATKQTSKVLNGLDWLDLSKLTEEMSRKLELVHLDP